ncbi:MAG TPA: TIGR01777 family oxidoreductase [Candidatus Acidoferrum sp.]|jgi:hypothetical protein
MPTTERKAGRRIVLVGGRGQVGTLLARHFHALGDEVVVIARTTYSAPWKLVAWNGERAGPWVEELESTDVVINLAGRSVNCRYNRSNRREILESRVRSTQLLGEVIGSLPAPPKVWLNASTATIYRHALDRAMDEVSGEIGGMEAGAPDSWRFSIEVAQAWEQAFFAADTPKTRKVALRSAMTMSPDRGGVFDALLRLVRFGLGGAAGSGEQFVTWIHEMDFVRAVEFVIAHQEIEGVVNVASPKPIPNTEFMKSLREAWGIGYGLDANQWMLEVGVFLLRTETELILKSRRVIPGRLLESGFQFQFPEWTDAAKELVDRWKMQRNGLHSVVAREEIRA